MEASSHVIYKVILHYIVVHPSLVRQRSVYTSHLPSLMIWFFSQQTSYDLHSPYRNIQRLTYRNDSHDEKICLPVDWSEPSTPYDPYLFINHQDSYYSIQTWFVSYLIKPAWQILSLDNDNVHTLYCRAAHPCIAEKWRNGSPPLSSAAIFLSKNIVWPSFNLENSVVFFWIFRKDLCLTN